MTHTPFFKGLLLTTILATIISFGLALLPQEESFQEIIFGSLVFFASFSIFQYFFGRKAASLKNKGIYIGVVQILSFVKIAFTLLFVVLFVKYGEPESNWFVLPFLLNYVIFTVFETATMMRVGQEKN